MMDIDVALCQSPNALGLIGPSAYLTSCAGEPEKALAIVENAEAAVSSAVAAQSATTIILSWLDRHEEAILCGRKAANTLAGSPTMAVSLPYALAKAGRLLEAQEELGRSSSNPDMPPAPTMLAPVYLGMGRIDLASAAFQKGIEEGCIYQHVQRFDPRLAYLPKSDPPHIFCILTLRPCVALVATGYHDCMEFHWL